MVTDISDVSNPIQMSMDGSYPLLLLMSLSVMR